MKTKMSEITSQQISKVIDILTELRDIQDLIDKNQYRSRAYTTVINALREGKSIEESGAKKKMMKKINEIIETGRCSELDEYKSKYAPILSNLRFLLSIPTIGMKKAKEIISDHMEDIARRNYTIKIDDLLSRKDLTNRQKRIIKNFGKLVTSISRESVEKVVKHLYKYVFAKYDITHVIVGSYRREREFIHDIDIMLYTDEPDFDTFRNVINDIKRMGKFVESVNSGQRNFTFLFEFMKGKIVSIDIKYYHSDELIPALIYFTGSKLFNIKLRMHAKSMGYKLNQYGLYDKEMKKIQLKDEKELFRILNLPFTSPKERE